MGLLVYKFSEYRTTHEREQFRILCNSLREYYSSRDEWCIFLANYNIYDTELDGLLIKQDAIMCVEFKKHGGEITAVDNGQWTTSDGTVIKGGSGKTVYQQVNINHVCVRKGMKAATSLSNKQLSDIAALVVFHRPITTLYNNLSEATQCWLHITDNNHFLEKVKDITTDKLFLEPQQMQKLVEELNLSEYYLEEEYSNPELLDMDFSEEEEVPIEGNEGPVQPINEVKKFGKKEEPIVNTSDVSNTQEQPVVDLSKFAPICREDVEIWTKSVFHTLNIDKFIEVYDTLVDSVPSWIINEHGHRFIVVSFMYHDEIVAFEKHTHLHVRHHKSYNYWFCDVAGASSTPPAQQNITDSSQTTNAEPVKIDESRIPNLNLPTWLDQFLFGKLGAQYAPDHEQFTSNLDSDEQKVKIYLGTYFPRSCAESYIIAKDLFQSAVLKEKYQNRSVLNVLDIACGTGGELIGLLLAIFDFLPNVKHITICAIDGNPYALKFFKKILTEVKKNFPEKTIALSNAAIPLNTKSDLQLLGEIVSEDYDFIFSNKSGNELISIAGDSSNAYELILNSFASKLSANGLMMVLDVTSKNSNGEFCPNALNAAFNKFVKSHPEYRTIIPIACGFHEKKCRVSCFTQRHIQVSHCKKNGDLSKITYRIIARSEMADVMLLGKENQTYLTAPDKDSSVCPHSSSGSRLNSFIINQ